MGVLAAKPPTQKPISEQRLAAMLEWKPRRMRLSTQWPRPLYPPSSAGRDPCLVLPFEETFGAAFEAMCAQVPHTRFRTGSGGKPYAFLKGASEENGMLPSVRLWLETVGAYVGLRDCMSVSFALDYDKENGDPNEDQTAVGSLRSRAKPYGGAATPDTYVAADALRERCVAFLQTMTCYACVDTVVAMPPSDPAKPFDLPSYLALGVARALDVGNGSDRVVTTGPRPQLKSVPVAEKLATIRDTISVEGSFEGRNVLLLDDLYQSGVSANYVAMLLLQSGARRVLGLACEKTCRNDDNTARPS